MSAALDNAMAHLDAVAQQLERAIVQWEEHEEKELCKSPTWDEVQGAAAAAAGKQKRRKEVLRWLHSEKDTAIWARDKINAKRAQIVAEHEQRIQWAEGKMGEAMGKVEVNTTWWRDYLCANNIAADVELAEVGIAFWKGEAGGLPSLVAPPSGVAQPSGVVQCSVPSSDPWAPSRNSYYKDWNIGDKLGPPPTTTTNGGGGDMDSGASTTTADTPSSELSVMQREASWVEIQG